MKQIIHILQKQEKQYATYLFKKYILPTLDPSTATREYNKYMGQLFIKRKSVISQLDFIKEDCETIDKADSLYNANPEHYPNHKTVYGYPDEYRCNYIIQHMHKLIRCRKKIIIEHGNNLCNTHCSLDNTYLAEYELMCSKL